MIENDEDEKKWTTNNIVINCVIIFSFLFFKFKHIYVIIIELFLRPIFVVHFHFFEKKTNKQTFNTNPLLSLHLSILNYRYDSHKTFTDPPITTYICSPNTDFILFHVENKAN